MSPLHSIVGQARVRVRYAETDKMGVVYHSNFIVWFEVGRVELLRQLGFSYRDMELQDDCHIAVVDVRCRYKSPAYYDDELIVRTRLKNLRGSLMVFDYQVRRLSDDVILAEGETTHLVVNAKMEKTVLPEKYLNAFAAAVAREGDQSNSTTGKSNG
ncbi:MAG: 4-hydroxybenzoyl-CoA thioesterase [Acidobacteriaceae bacterium]|nr:4-hydroxybenzoyl-CoA thioesterase [Acidobacteriaceae bacterium]